MQLQKKSSSLNSHYRRATYDYERCILTLETRDRHVYSYSGVPMSIYSSLPNTYKDLEFVLKKVHGHYERSVEHLTFVEEEIVTLKALRASAEQRKKQDDETD